MKKTTIGLSGVAAAVLMALSCNVYANTSFDVSASSKSANAQKTVDNNLDTRWSVKGDDGNDWLQYDFNKVANITAVNIAFHKGNKRSHEFEIQSSENGIDWNLDLQAKSSAKTTQLETFILDKPLTTSHLRIVGFGNTRNNWNTITEVSFVEGESAEGIAIPVDIEPVNVENEDKISVIAFASTDDGNEADATLDNDPDTRWSAKGDGEWIAFDMGSTHTVEELQIAFFKGDERDADIEIQISSDKSAWTTIWNESQPLATLDKMSFDVTDAAGRYVRIVGYGNSENAWNSITEVVILGIAGGTPIEEPVVEEPVVEEPIVEEPVAEEPVVEEPVAEEPVVEEPVVEEPVVEEPVVEEPVVEEPVAEEPIDDESITTANVITVGTSGAEDYTTIQAAIDAISSVDTTILVTAGTYKEKIEFDNCGSAAGYLVIQGEDGAIMSGTSGDAFYLEDCSYVKIRGLEITGYDQGIEVAENSDYIYIENNYLHHIGDDKNSLVVYVHGGDNKDPNEEIYILNNEMSYNTTGNSEVLTVNGNVDGFVIQGNHVHHNNNIGIDVIGFEGNGPDGLDQARNGLIADNKVEYISTEGGPGFDRNPTYSKNDYSADCIYVDGGKNIIIERNIVENCDLGIELASEHEGENTENIIVRNNFVSNSYQGNITMGGYDSDKGNAVNIEVYNNTTYNGRDAEILVQYNTSNVTIKNNIFYGKSGTDYLSNIGSNNSNFTVSNNIYYGADKTEGDWNDTNPHFVNPQFVNISTLDLHIETSSPAKNAGESITGNDFLALPYGGHYDIDLDTRVNSQVDIGADEL